MNDFLHYFHVPEHQNTYNILLHSKTNLYEVCKILCYIIVFIIDFNS
jgi:hypothetical protein